MITKQETAELTKKFGGSEKNSGATEVQVAILTRRIKNLMNHFEKRVLRWIELAREELLDIRSAKLPRWQANIVDHQQRDITDTWPSIKIRGRNMPSVFVPSFGADRHLGLAFFFLLAQ